MCSVTEPWKGWNSGVAAPSIHVSETSVAFFPSYTAVCGPVESTAPSLRSHLYRNSPLALSETLPVNVNFTGQGPLLEAGDTVRSTPETERAAAGGAASVSAASNAAETRTDDWIRMGGSFRR